MVLLDGTELSDKEVEVTVEDMREDGFYYNVMNSKKVFSASSIKLLLQSVAAFKFQKELTGTALNVGRLLHQMVLEPEKAENVNIIESTKTSKAYKEMFAKHPHSTYTDKEHSQALFLSKGIKSNPLAMDYIDGTQKEVPMLGIVQGQPFKGKADGLGNNYIMDIKTTTDIKEFKRSAVKYGYDIQSYIYTHLFNVPNMIFIVVDKANRDMGIFSTEESFLSDGEEKVKEAIDKYNKFIKADLPMWRTTIQGKLTGKSLW